MSIYLAAIGIVICICPSAFCSASEMAFSSCNRLRLENSAEDGSKKAKVALKIIDRFDDAFHILPPRVVIMIIIYPLLLLVNHIFGVMP